MRLLNQLVELCRPRKVRFLNVLGQGGNADRLKELIVNYPHKDEQAIFDLLDSKTATQQYRSELKAKLEDRLINTILAINPKSKAQHAEISYRRLKKVAVAVDTLAYERKLPAAIALAKKHVQSAIDFDFNDVVVTLARLLVHHYAVSEPEGRAYRKYKIIHLTAVEKLYTEGRIHDLFCEFSIYFKSKNTTKRESLAKIVERCKLLMKSDLSYRSALFGFNVLVLFQMYEGRFEEAEKSAKKAIRFFESNANYPTRPIFSFNYKLIPIYIQQGRYDAANTAIQQCLAIENKDTRNYLLVKRYQAILSLRMEDYQEARNICNAIDFKALDQRSLEDWRICEAYAILLTYPAGFRLGKFLNEMEVFQHDKKGHNINLIILEWLFRIAQGEQEKLIDRIAALKRYIYRHLPNVERGRHIRSRIFLKILVDLAENAFEWQHSKVQARVNQLQLIPASVSGQDVDLEVMRYESLLIKVAKILGEANQ